MREFGSLSSALALAVALVAGSVQGAAAQEASAVAPFPSLTAPSGPVVLTVSGQIEVVNRDQHAVFDRAQLESLGLTSYDTTTIWTTGVQRFEGVPIASLMAALGAKGSAIRATALNDYAVEIPMEDAVQGRALLAIRMNGEELSPRDKGPIWVIYPYDAGTEFQTEVIYSRSIWQLNRIEVLP